MPSFMAKRRRRKRERQQQQAAVTPVTTPAAAVPETIPASESPLRRLLRRTSSLASGLSRRRTRDSTQNDVLVGGSIGDGRSPDRYGDDDNRVPATPPPLPSQRQRLSSLSQNSRGITPLTPSPVFGRTIPPRAADDSGSSPLRPTQSQMQTQTQTQKQTQEKHQHQRNPSLSASASDVSLAESLKHRGYSGSHRLPVAETRPTNVAQVQTIASSSRLGGAGNTTRKMTGETKDVVIAADKPDKSLGSSRRSREEEPTTTTTTPATTAKADAEPGFERFQQHPAAVTPPPPAQDTATESSSEVERQTGSPHPPTPAPAPALAPALGSTVGNKEEEVEEEEAEEEEGESEPSRSYLSLRTALATPPRPGGNDLVDRVAPPLGPPTTMMTPGSLPLSSLGKQVGKGGGTARFGGGPSSPSLSSLSSSSSSVHERIVPEDSMMAMSDEAGQEMRGGLSHRVDSPSPPSNANTSNARLALAQEPVPSLLPLTPPTQHRLSDTRMHQVERAAPIVLGAVAAAAPTSYSHGERLPAVLFGTSQRTTRASGLVKEKGKEEGLSDEIEETAAALAGGAVPGGSLGDEAEHENNPLAVLDSSDDPFVVSASSSSRQTTTDHSDSKPSKLRVQESETTAQVSPNPRGPTLVPTAQEKPNDLEAHHDRGNAEREDVSPPLTESNEQGLGAVVPSVHAGTDEEEQALDNDSSSAGKPLDDPFVAPASSSVRHHAIPADSQEPQTARSPDFEGTRAAESRVPALQRAAEGIDRELSTGASSAQLDTVTRETSPSRLTNTIEGALGPATLDADVEPSDMKQELDHAATSMGILEDPLVVRPTSAHPSTMSHQSGASEEPSAEQTTPLGLAGQDAERDSVAGGNDAIPVVPEHSPDNVKPSEDLAEADVRALPTDSGASHDAPGVETGREEEAEAVEEAEDEAEPEPEPEEGRGISQVLDSADLSHIRQTTAGIQQPAHPTADHDPIRSRVLAFSPAEHAAHLVSFSPRGFMTPIEEVPTPVSVQDESTVRDPDEHHLHEAATTELPLRTPDEGRLAKESVARAERLVTRYVEPEETVDITESADDAVLAMGQPETSKRLPFPTSSSSSTLSEQSASNDETAIDLAQPVNNDRPLLPFVPRLFAPRLTLEFKWTDRLLPSDITLNTSTATPVTTMNVVALRPRERRISVYDTARNVSAYGASYVPRNRLTSWAFGERQNA
ncbi:hypothetical protein QFC24_006525 [Naganishia onofrii]|uniref:Uncharacterized protein n=1 Tax=Naganishia onofrii TaxID=1851511 RepID=A0ACC2X089_9TREE|nr:hypothetical protein QFC24_006525 [Naganishia onofrii]